MIQEEQESIGVGKTLQFNCHCCFVLSARNKRPHGDDVLDTCPEDTVENIIGRVGGKCRDSINEATDNVSRRVSVSHQMARDAVESL